MRVTVPPLADRRRESRFFSTLAGVVAVVVLAGFAPTYYRYGGPADSGGYTPGERVLGIHGVLVAAWFLLLLLQATLVRKGFMRLHRGVGIAGMLLAVFVVVVGLLGTSIAAKQPDGFLYLSLAPTAFMVVPLADLLLFGTFVLFAYFKRRGKKSHKRLMMLAAMSLLSAPLARLLPSAWLQSAGFLPVYLAADLVLIALALWDTKSLGRLHPVTLWGGLLVLASQPGRMMIAETALWQSIAEWALRLA
jgi:hypothetical protein